MKSTGYTVGNLTFGPLGVPGFDRPHDPKRVAGGRQA